MKILLHRPRPRPPATVATATSARPTGCIDTDVASPVELGGAGGATNPEQLFAAGYAACFLNALLRVGRHAQGRCGRRRGHRRGRHRHRRRGHVRPRRDAEDHHARRGAGRQAEQLVEAAHQVCPYSNATRGNIDVVLGDRGMTRQPRDPPRLPPARAGRRRRTSPWSRSTCPTPGRARCWCATRFMSVDPYMRGPDERRPVLRAAVRGRRGPGRRRGRRGGGLQQPRPRRRPDGAAQLRLARLRRRPGHGLPAGGPGRRPGPSAYLGRARHAGADRVRRAARHRRLPARRRGVRLRRRRGGRQRGRPDRPSCAAPPGSSAAPARPPRWPGCSELGFDAAFNYKDGPVREQLRRRRPGRHRRLLRQRRRRPPGGGDRRAQAVRPGRPVRRDLAVQRDRAGARAAQPLLAVGKRLTLRGFIVSDHDDRDAAFLAEVAPAVRRPAGSRSTRPLWTGWRTRPAAFLGLLRGDNLGKMVVRL